MAEESEKRFHAVMDKLFFAPPPNSKPTRTPSSTRYMVFLYLCFFFQYIVIHQLKFCLKNPVIRCFDPIIALTFESRFTRHKQATHNQMRACFSSLGFIHLKIVYTFIQYKCLYSYTPSIILNNEL